MNSGMKKKLVTVAKVSVSILLLVLLFSRIDFQDLWARYAQIQPLYLGLAIGILVLQTFLSSLKWWIILKADQHSTPLLFLWKTYLIANFLGLFLPSSIGGDFYRVYAVQGEGRDLGKSTSSVLFDRLSGLFALISIGFISSLFLPDNRYNGIMVALYFLGIAGFLLITSNQVVARLEQVKWKLFRPFLKILKSFNAYRSSRRTMLLIFAIAFFFQMNVVILNKMYTLALGIPMPFSKLLVIIPLIYLTEALPISINGLGVREGAFAFFFELMGRTKEEGVAVSLLVVFLRYFMGMVGGGLLLRNTLQRRGQPDNSRQDSSKQIVT